MLRQMLADSGLELEKVLIKLGYEDFNQFEAKVCAADYLKVLTFSAQELCDESLRLNSRRLLPGTNEFVLKNINQCQSIKEVLQSIANSYNIIHGGTYNRIEVNDRHLAYVIDDRDFPYSQDANQVYIDFILDNLLVFIHGIISCLVSVSIGDKVVKLHSKSAKKSLLSNAFHHTCVKHNACCYAIYYDVSLSTLSLTNQQPLTIANVYAELQHIIAKEQESSLIQQVTLLVQQGVRAQSDVANALHLSVASLKRKLNEQNTNFRAIKEQLVNYQAQQKLLTGINIEDCAQELGFSDARSFIRAFKNWNNITPTCFISQTSKLS